MSTGDDDGEGFVRFGCGYPDAFTTRIDLPCTRMVTNGGCMVARIPLILMANDHGLGQIRMNPGMVMLMRVCV